MTCQTCNNSRIASVTAKCSDTCSIRLGDSEVDGYVPDDLGIGGGDYVEFNFCLNCGQMQGNFPLPPSKIEKNITDEEVVEFFNNYFTEGDSTYLDKSHLNKQEYLVRLRVINYAEELSPIFSLFIRDYFQFNSDRTPRRKHPSAERFVQMYRDKDADLMSV